MRYERPVLVTSFSFAELRADAATCTLYLPTPTVTAVSDERLKTDIELI